MLKFDFRRFYFWFLYVQIISFVERKANSPIEQQKCKSHEKRDQFLVSKVDFKFQISQQNEKLTHWNSFLKLGSFFKNVSIIIFLEFQRALMPSIFFLWNSLFPFFNKN